MSTSGFVEALPHSERRQAPITGEFAMRVGLAWLAVSVLVVLVNWQRISGGLFPDPDDTMRLIQVRDWLAGQSWFDVTQYRANAPGGGVAMHWSRLVDLPLGATIAVLTPLLGAQGAENTAIILVPILTLGVAMTLAARIAWRLLGQEETTLTALVLALSVPVIFQLGPLRIDHHGWQLVCALIAMNGLMARSAHIGGAVIGGSLAIWLAISIEGLPLAAAIFAVLAWRWLRDRNERTWLVSAMLALFVTSGAAFAMTRGLSDLRAYCDAISPVHVTMFGFGAASIWLLARFDDRLSLPALISGFGVVGGGALGLFVYAAPQCATGGGFAELDPLVHDFWYVNVNEGLPIWHQTPTVILQYAVTPLVGLYAAVNLTLLSQGWDRRFWFDYSLVLGASFLIALLVARAGAAACLIAAPPLAWQLNRWFKALRETDKPVLRVMGMLAVVCTLLPTFPIALSNMVLPAQARETSSENQADLPAPGAGHLKTSDCRIEESADILNDLPRGEIFAPLDIAPKLLLESHHSVPATGHHRGSETMRLVIATALRSSQDARQTLHARGTRYVALCPKLVEPRNYAFNSADGFFADLLEERTPDWLEPIPTAPGTSFQLWRVVTD